MGTSQISSSKNVTKWAPRQARVSKTIKASVKSSVQALEISQFKQKVEIKNRLSNLVISSAVLKQKCYVVSSFSLKLCQDNCVRVLFLDLFW